MPHNFPALLFILHATTEALGHHVPIVLVLVFRSGRHCQRSGRAADRYHLGPPILRFGRLIHLQPCAFRSLVRHVLSLKGTLFVLIRGATFLFRKAPHFLYLRQYTTKRCSYQTSGRTFRLIVSGTKFCFWGTYPFRIRHTPCSVSISHPAFIILLSHCPTPYLVVH